MEFLPIAQIIELIKANANVAVIAIFIFASLAFQYFKFKNFQTNPDLQTHLNDIASLLHNFEKNTHELKNDNAIIKSRLDDVWDKINK